MTSTPLPTPDRHRSPVHRLLPIGVWSCLMATPAVTHADIAPPDWSPPKVSIKTPRNGLQLPAGTHRIKVVVDAHDPQSGVDRVVLKVDGKVVKRDRRHPFRFSDVELGPGRHELVAVATNYYDRRARSNKVVVVVPEPAPAEPVPAEAPPSEAPPVDPETPPAGAETKIELSPASPPDRAELAPQTVEPDETREANEGCFASVRPRSLYGSGLALLFAAFAGLALRRRRP